MRYQRKINWKISVGISLLLTAAVLFVLFFLRGETTVTKKVEEAKKSATLTCEADGLVYPFFEYDESIKKTLKVNVVFKGNGLDTIALIYKLYYNDTKKITDSENLNRVAMSKNFDNDGLEFGALGSQYSKAKDLLQFSLYASGDQINNVSVKYFMSSGAEEGVDLLGSMRREYESKGLKCVVNE